MEVLFGFIIKCDVLKREREREKKPNKDTVSN